VWVFIVAIVCSVLIAQWLPQVYSSTVRIEVQENTPEVDMLHPVVGHPFSPNPYFLPRNSKSLSLTTF
jgi:hypothetical protein